MSALADLRVLDLTQVLAGPYCTMLLADMGADVVKVERPGGDLIRANPPYVADPDAESYGGYFQSVNRGKRSLELDLTTDADRDAFLSLVERADVVVENFKAGTMERFDCGYERLRERNPQLVYSSIRGFGDPRTGETERQGQPSFDLIAQALGGVMEITGQEDGPPTKVGPGVGDIFTAALNAVGILAAVHHRERTGEGQYVDTAMYDCMVSLAERSVYQYSCDGESPTRQGNSHPTLFPYDAFEAADGYVVVAAFSDGHWQTLCEAMDRPDLAAEYPAGQSRTAASGARRLDPQARVGGDTGPAGRPRPRGASPEYSRHLRGLARPRARDARRRSATGRRRTDDDCREPYQDVRDDARTAWPGAAAGRTPRGTAG